MKVRIENVQVTHAEGQGASLCDEEGLSGYPIFARNNHWKIWMMGKSLPHLCKSRKARSLWTRPHKRVTMIVVGFITPESTP